MRRGEREEALESPREPAAVPSVAPSGRLDGSLVLRLQRSAGNAAVTALVGGRPAQGGSALRAAPLTAGDANVIARLADTARMRNALAPPPGAQQPDLFKAAAAHPPVHPADLAAGDVNPPVHPADLAAGDVDSPVDSGARSVAGPHRPAHHRAVRRPAPAATVPAVDPELDAEAAQLADLRARAPELAREIVDAALGPRGQVAAYRALAEPGFAAEEQAVTRVLQAAADPSARRRGRWPITHGCLIPALAQELEEQAIKTLEWEPLNEVGELQTPGFSAGLLIREVRGAIRLGH